MVMKVRHYADGGKVASEKPPPRPRPAPRPAPPAPKPDTRERRSTMDIVSGKTRREQEAALGLKDGGKVKRRKKRRY